MSSPVWLITGASNGFGLALTLRVLSAGHRVIGTVRSRSKSAGAVQQIEDAGGSVIELDMTDSQANIAAKLTVLDRIDVLVNNAGYSILGACEDISSKDAHLQIDTNFFGPLFTTQAILPVMRKQQSGTIVQISSGAAQDPLAACSLYSASKAALEAASESLAHEVAPHNIKVLIVEPGNFRTNFVSALGNASGDPNGVAQHYDDPVGVIMRKFLTIHGKQMGDPERAAERIYEAVTGQGMAGEVTGKVTRLILGSDAWARMKKCGEKFLEDVNLQEKIAQSTAFSE